jgi:annexin A7/11
MVSPEKDAEALYEAMDKLNTDEEAIIKIIANRTNAHRLQIVTEYKNKYDKNLIDDLKSNLSGDFETASVALFLSPIDYDVLQLNKSMSGVNTDEDSLIEIICSRPQTTLQEIKEKYKETHSIELEEKVTKATGGDLQRLLLTILKCERSTNTTSNHEESSKKAKELIEIGESNWCKENSAFEQLLLTGSKEEIMLCAKYYHKKTQKTILKAIEENFEGDVKTLFTSIIYATLNPSEFYARKVHKAIEGFGTDDNTLIRILVTRDEVDMPKIKQYYKKMFEKDMIEDIKSDCSGDYLKLLVELAGH